jgi:very-short-patch-repair endonuclease
VACRPVSNSGTLGPVPPSAPPPRAPSPSSTLERHQRRRDQGIPTLSVLAGPPAAALSLWTGWLAPRGQPLALGREGEARAGVREWLTVLERAVALSTLAADFLGDAQGLARGTLPARLAGKTAYERELLLGHAESTLRESDASTVSLRLLRLDPQVVHKSGGLPEALLATWDVEPPRVLAAVHALVPEGRAPALLLSGSGGPEALASAARLAARVCDAVPSLPVALQAAPGEVDAYLAGGESQARALVREGRLTLEAPSAGEVGRRLEALGVPRGRVPDKALERLAEDGVSDEVLEHYGEAAREREAAAHAPGTPEAQDRARSKAERFLYELLQSLPDTRGLFELNVPTEFPLRGRPVEVDLLSRRLRVAVEVDGYHHFRDEERYRRDRRKDLALQRHGYWVVRFLADDVVARLEEIRDTLREVVSLRREGPGGSASQKEEGDAGL